MIRPPFILRAVRVAAAIAACLFGVFLAVDTVRTVVPLWSPLPWFDEWATVGLIRQWARGDMSAGAVLFAQHNEHRILVPRLVFFADDLLFRGGGYLCLAAIGAVQAAHAGLFTAVLARARPRDPGRWAMAGVVLALMFSLRQAENVSSPFQLQFVAVFAGATLTFVLFGLAARRIRDGTDWAWPFAASFGASLVTPFTMANGLLAGYVLVALALAARLRPRIALACAVWAMLLTTAFLHGYSFGQPHRMAPDLLRTLPLYVCAYLGSVVTPYHADQAASFGALGLAATVGAWWRVLRLRGDRAGPLAMAGVMLFVVATAAVTAEGRLDQGLGQALSSRYATGSVAFWAAQIAFWWSDPPLWRLRVGGIRLPRAAVARGAVTVVVCVLCLSLAKDQNVYKPDLAAKSFSQNEAADLLMLGLSDPAVVRRVAWGDADMGQLLPVLAGAHLSIFGTRDFLSLGRAVASRGDVADACGGGVMTAAADPALGAGGVRVAGLLRDGVRARRVLLAEASGRIVGFASGAIPGAAREAWRGFAVAPAGTTLAAYAVFDGSRLCPSGTAAVAGPSAVAPPGGLYANQPVLAP